MVASSGHDIYSTLQHDMKPEEGVRSSGESSDLQSPTHQGRTLLSLMLSDNCKLLSLGLLEISMFSPTFFQKSVISWKLKVHAAIIALQHDYASLTAQQPPLLEISLQMSLANAHTGAYPDYYTVSPPPRSHISHGYSVQQLPHAPGNGGRPIESRYTATSKRRLPSGPSSHDSSQPGQARMSVVLAYGNQKPPMSLSSGHQGPAMNTAPSGDLRKSQKKTTSTTAVIACRQWCVSRSYRSDFIKSLIKTKIKPSTNPTPLGVFLDLSQYVATIQDPRTLDDLAVLPPPLAPPLQRRRTTADRDRSLLSIDDNDDDDDNDALPPAKRTMPSDTPSPQ
ncbi:hypothetical protein C0993_009250 [Termitomyces sp. T159_Od127]|nr:hypothetical protein C0993_009250 [Termitomyces sp. T159_Od127]